jgi:hypothetical protein
MSLKSLLAVAGVALFSATAFAAGDDIPTRYQGKFPGVAAVRDIAGTYKGRRLTLKLARDAGRRALPRRAKAASPTRMCPLDRLLAP